MEVPDQQITKRIMIGVPMTGLVRAEWMLARYTQTIPCNWSQLDAIQWISTNAPLRYLVADARNLLATTFVEKEYEWLWFIDHDVILPNGTLMQWDERMLKCDVPVWSGLYFCKAVPATPLIYRGRGNSYFDKWKMGDEVWCDGLPMGNTFIHKSIMKVLYDESEWYQVKSDVKAKKIFETPRDTWYSTSENAWHNSGGTEDLCWCTRVMKDNIFKKAGWPKYQKKKYPFLVDTKIFCRHINFDGQQFPSEGEELQFVRK